MSKDLSSKPAVSGQQRLYKSERLALILALVFGTIGLFLLCQMIGVYLVFGILTILGNDTNAIDSLLTNNVVIRFLVILLIELVTLGALWLLHSIKKQPFLKSVGLGARPKLIHLGYSAATYGLYFLTLLVTVGIVSKLIPGLDTNQVQQIGFDTAKGFDLVFVFLTLVVLPPIAEEILFRGFLFSRLKTQAGVYTAAIITSTIFALAHTEFLGDNPLNWIAALDTFVFSFFLIFLYVKTKSLWPSIFLHGIKNCVAFIFLFLL